MSTQQAATAQKRTRQLTYDPRGEIIRAQHLPIVTGMSATTIWRWRLAGRFPAGIRLGANSLGFRRTDILEWLAAREAAGAEAVTKESR